MEYEDSNLKIKELRVNRKYRHHRSKEIYEVKEILPIKIDGSWLLAGLVVYEYVETGLRFSRLTENFLESFEELE